MDGPVAPAALENVVLLCSEHFEARVRFQMDAAFLVTAVPATLNHLILVQSSSDNPLLLKLLPVGRVHEERVRYGGIGRMSLL